MRGALLIERTEGVGPDLCVDYRWAKSHGFSLDNVPQDADLTVELATGPRYVARASPVNGSVSLYQPGDLLWVRRLHEVMLESGQVPTILVMRLTVPGHRD